MRVPWGRTRLHDLIRIVDAVAREVIAASDSGTGPLGLPADRRQGSSKSLASMRNLPYGPLAWICPPAAELVQQQEALRREFSISRRYFKACAALFASIR